MPEQVEKVDGFEVLGVKVLIKLDKREEKKGDFYVPTEYQEQRQDGVIVKIGKLVKRDIYPVEVGQRVKINEWIGIDVRFKNDDNEYKMVHPDDILLIQTKGDTK